MRQIERLAEATPDHRARGRALLFDYAGAPFRVEERAAFGERDVAAPERRVIRSGRDSRR